MCKIFYSIPVIILSYLHFCFMTLTKLNAELSRVSAKPVISFANKSFVKLQFVSWLRKFIGCSSLMHDGILHCSHRNAVKQGQKVNSCEEAFTNCSCRFFFCVLSILLVLFILFVSTVSTHRGKWVCRSSSPVRLFCRRKSIFPASVVSEVWSAPFRCFNFKYKIYLFLGL